MRKARKRSPKSRNRRSAIIARSLRATSPHLMAAEIYNIPQVVEVYGGRQALARAFHYPSTAFVEDWQKHWIPAGAHLGLYLGLKARGYEAMPQLFGLTQWSDLFGM